MEEVVSTSKVADTPVSNTTDFFDEAYSVSKSQIKRWARLRITVKTLSFWNHLLFFKEKICQ